MDGILYPLPCEIRRLIESYLDIDTRIIHRIPPGRLHGEMLRMPPSCHQRMIETCYDIESLRWGPHRLVILSLYITCPHRDRFYLSCYEARLEPPLRGGSRGIILHQRWLFGYAAEPFFEQYLWSTELDSRFVSVCLP